MDGFAQKALHYAISRWPVMAADPWLYIAIVFLAFLAGYFAKRFLAKNELNSSRALIEAILAGHLSQEKKDELLFKPFSRRKKIWLQWLPLFIAVLIVVAQESYYWVHSPIRIYPEDEARLISAMQPWPSDDHVYVTLFCSITNVYGCAFADQLKEILSKANWKVDKNLQLGFFPQAGASILTQNEDVRYWITLQHGLTFKHISSSHGTDSNVAAEEIRIIFGNF